jgi:hypothetical protein
VFLGFFLKGSAFSVLESAFGVLEGSAFGVLEDSAIWCFGGQCIGVF